MTTGAALQELVPSLLSIYGNLIDSIILYGSVVRDMQTDESDMDIAVIMCPGATAEMHDRMLGMVVDLELACDKVLSVIRVDRDRFKEWETTLPFYSEHPEGGHSFMAGRLIELSAHRFNRAKEELQTAELLMKHESYRQSINRSYYAIFHAVRAVNALDGFDSSKHSGAIAHFNQQYVKTGVFDKEASVFNGAQSFMDMAGKFLTEKRVI